MKHTHRNDKFGIETDAHDRRLQAILHSSPVPPDLADELILRVREASAANETASMFEARSRELEAASSDSSTLSVAPTRSIFGRRRMLYVTSVVAAALLLLVGSISWLGSSKNTDELVVHCLAKLKELREEDWVPNTPLRPVVVAFVEQNLSLLQPRVLVGEQDLPAGDFGAQCELWKLSDSRGEIFIFVFSQPASVGQLSTQLEVIQGSGGWSLAAVRNRDRMTVVATLGDIRKYIQMRFV